nr:hypothetical protein [Tanacetum cinerariifolium]
MTFITAQQTKLDLELVPKENRLDIRKCSGKIPRGLKPKEETFQVVMDALALTLCYPTFIITADVPEVYMHQFWNSVYKHHDFYRFKIDKKKRFKLTLEVFRDIFQICPRIKDQYFDALPSEKDTVSFLREISHTRVINSLNDVVINQMHQPWRTFAALINRSLSGKTTDFYKLRLSRAHILWGMARGKGRALIAWNATLSFMRLMTLVTLIVMSKVYLVSSYASGLSSDQTSFCQVFMVTPLWIHKEAEKQVSAKRSKHLTSFEESHFNPP